MTQTNSAIPKGWKIKTLGEVAELLKYQWKPGDEEKKYIGLEHINLGELSTNGFGYSSNPIFLLRIFLFEKIKF